MSTIILLVDDSPVMLKVLQSTLKEGGDYELLTAGNARDAMRLTLERRPSLIISDYYMPEVDGLTFCRQVKEHPLLCHTMFMLLTAASEIESRVKGLESGADDYITKPFHPKELCSKVKALLRIKFLQDELQQDKAELQNLNSELMENFAGVMGLLGHIIGLRVFNAGARAQRAARLSGWVGKRLGLDDASLKTAEVAALIHEIGKITLPDELLKKELTDLTADERDQLAQFPILGQRLVETIPPFDPVADIIRYQMENFDGSGYPDRLMADEIPAGAQMLRAVNLIEDVILRQDLGAEELIDIVRGAKGTVLNPRVALLAEEYLRVSENPAWKEDKCQVAVPDLREGMVLAGDLYTGSGAKLLSKGAKLVLSHIERIQSIHQYDPIINEIYVLSGV